MLPPILQSILFWCEKSLYKKTDNYNTILKGVVTYKNENEIYIKGNDGNYYRHSNTYEKKYTNRKVNYMMFIVGCTVSFRLSHENPNVVDLRPINKENTSIFKATVDYINIGKTDERLNFGNLKIDNDGEITDLPIGYHNISNIKSFESSNIDTNDSCFITVKDNKIVDIEVIKNIH